jgi:DNA-binding MarR family transcriptional regulator
MASLSRVGREREVAGRLHHAAIQLLRRLRRSDAALGLTPARASALSVLVFGGPLRLGALARAEGVSNPTMSRIVSALVAAGLARRTLDRDDARAALLRATAKGRRLLLRGRELRLAALFDLLRRLPDQDLRTLGAATAILERLAATAEPRAAVGDGAPG